MKKAGLFILLVVVLQSLNAQLALKTGTSNLTSGNRSVRTLTDPGTAVQFSKYGGCLSKRVETTGFFYTKMIDNTWYVVDPEGYLFLSAGINSVVKGGNFVLPDSLRSIGCNTMGCWSDETINTTAANKIAYCPRWNMMLNYKNTSQRTKDLYAAGIIPVFDAEFANYCTKVASTEIALLKNDPYILGHFSDNELPVYDNTTYGNLLDRFIAITNKSDPNYLAADNWMRQRKGSPYSISASDRLDFHGYVTGTYYRIVNTAIKKYDPNHLYLGSRLHGGAKSAAPIFREAGKYVDIISINVYGVWTLSAGDMDMWTNESQKPFLITEFYAKAEDTGLLNSDGAGWLVKTQNDRALFFENFVLSMLGHRGCIGYHYFKYIDNLTVNTGLVNTAFQWYQPMRNSYAEIAKDIYNLRDFLIYGYSERGVVSLFSAADYQQQALLLPGGRYSKAALAQLGFTPSTLTSLKIKPGCTAMLYTGDEFTGDSIEVKANTANLGLINFANKTGSLKIKDTGFVAGTSKFYKNDLIKIYPNPFSESIHIDFEKAGEGNTLSLYTISGKLVINKLLSGSKNELLTSFLQNGTYVLKVGSTEKGSGLSTLIVKN